VDAHGSVGQGVVDSRCVQKSPSLAGAYIKGFSITARVCDWGPTRHPIRFWPCTPAQSVDRQTAWPDTSPSWCARCCLPAELSAGCSRRGYERIVGCTPPCKPGSQRVTVISWCPRSSFGGRQAIAHVVTTAKNGAVAYRQTRFYRRTATGWVQTAPDAALWGPARSLEPPFFIYHFRQNDAQAVEVILPQMEALYRVLRRNFGLPLIPDSEKLVIKVSVTQPRGQPVPRFRGATGSWCLRQQMD
jgi:hypothetical protein